MLFYKLQGVCAEAVCGDDRQAKKELTRRIAIATADYNSINSDECFFVSDITDDIVTIGLITKYFVHPVKATAAYADFIGLDIQDVIVDEITINKIESLLNDADRHDYIEDDSDILEQFELDKITGRMGRGITFGENLTKEEQTKEALIAVANKYFMTETLCPELERIYAGRKNAHASGHPVHYFVEADNRDTRREIYKTLLDGSVYENDLQCCILLVR